MRKYIIYAVIAAVSLLTGCGRNDQAPVFELEEEKTETASDWDEEKFQSLLEEILEEKLSSLNVDSVIQVTCTCTGETQVQQIQGEALQSVPAAPPEDGKVNINTADITALQTLNGIGEARAQAIISYRESFGAFQTIEDIKQVDGIADGVFGKIKDEISVG